MLKELKKLLQNQEVQAATMSEKRTYAPDTTL